jgi:uncharacterized protein YlxP (DUF503 family)
MVLCNCLLHIDLPHIHSLKGRRSVTNAIKERLKRYNLSLLDLSGEYAREADIAFVFLSPDSKLAAQYRDTIEQMLERYFPEYPCELDYEEL